MLNPLRGRTLQPTRKLKKNNDINLEWMHDGFVSVGVRDGPANRSRRLYPRSLSSAWNLVGLFLFRYRHV